MGRFDTTKATINANIKKNGNQEITGSILNSVMTEMVDATDAQLTELSGETMEAMLYATGKYLLKIPAANAGGLDLPIFGLKKGYQYTIRVSASQSLEGTIAWGMYKEKNGEKVFNDQLLKNGQVSEYTFIADDDYPEPIIFFWASFAKPALDCTFNIDAPILADVKDEIDVIESEVAEVARDNEGNKLDIQGILYGNVLGNLSQLASYSGYFNDLGGYVEDARYAYAYMQLTNVKSIKFVAPNFGNNGTAIVNVLDKDKQFIDNLINWGNIDNAKYDISSLPQGAAYLVVSVPSADLSIVSYYLQTTSIAGLSESVLEIKKEQLYLDAKVNGGDIEESIAKFPIVKGQYVNSIGTIHQNAGFSYSLIPRNDADIVILDAPNMVDTCIVNLVDANGSVVTNLGEWIKLNNLIIPNELHTSATSIGLSFKNADIGNIIVTSRYIGVKSNDNASLSDIDEMSARYDAAYNKTLAADKSLIKGLFIDCARKYFSISNLKKFIDDAAEAGLNTFFYYFSDNQGFRFALNDMSVNVNDATYDLSVCLGDGVGGGDGTNKWITEAEMDDLISYANAKGLQFIPAFDMPGHMGAIRLHFNSSEFMETTELGRKWMVAVYKKYVSYFASRGCKYFNICGDEYNGDKGAYDKIITQLIHCVTSYGLIPMLYNDEICRNGYLNPFISNGAIILGWNRRDGQALYHVIRDSGYKMLNAKGFPYYWVLGVTNTSDSLLASIRTTNPFIMADNSEDKDIQGAVYHIWCDYPATDGADEGNNVYEQTKLCIQAFGQNMRSHFPCEYMPKEHICLKDANGAVYKLIISTSGEIIVSKLTN